MSSFYRVAIYMAGDGLVGYLDHRGEPMGEDSARTFNLPGKAFDFGERYCRRIKYTRFEVENVKTVVRVVSSGSYLEIQRREQGAG